MQRRSFSGNSRCCLLLCAGIIIEWAQPAAGTVLNAAQPQTIRYGL